MSLEDVNRAEQWGQASSITIGAMEEDLEGHWVNFLLVNLDGAFFYHIKIITLGGT